MFSMFTFALISKYKLAMASDIYEVIIIGGSYAGLSTAMALGRSLRNTLVIDAGDPCNKYTPHSHNFLTQDGKTPSEINQAAKDQVSQYSSVTFHEGFALSAARENGLFAVKTATAETFQGKILVLATGVKDIFPDIIGFEECWGKSIVHCPYCHGYEIKGLKTGILANGEKAIHMAGLVNNLTKDLTLLTNGEPDFNEEQSAKLKKHGIEIISQEIKSFQHTKGQIEHVAFNDGSTINFEAIYGLIPFEQHSNIPESLGCEFDEWGFIKVDNFQRTNIRNVYACGDNSTGKRSVAMAVAAGNMVGAVVNMQLVEESF